MCKINAVFCICAAFLVFSVTGLAAQSSRFTNPEPEGPANRIFTITEDFTLMAENEAVGLFLNEKTLAVRILNKKNGYIWSSDVEDFGDTYVNNHWKAFMRSGVTIEYYLEKAGSSDRRATEESFLDSELSSALVKPVPGGFRVDAVFGESGIGLSYETLITADGVEVSCKSEDIREAAVERIVSVQFYPFLGSVSYGSQPGYFVIPDGDGALIRFDSLYRNISRNYQKRYFGSDPGINAAEPYSGYLKNRPGLNFPVYGIVHGVRDNALMREIESGFLFAELLVYPAGTRTNFYFISNRYLFRQNYSYIVSTGTETTMITPERAGFGIRERFIVLSGDDACYAGIAKTYRAGLRRGFSGERPGASGAVPVYLNVWAGAASQGILRNGSIIMTSLENLGVMASQLAQAGMRNMHICYENAFKSGLSGTERDRYILRPGLGSEKKMGELSQSLAETGGRLVIKTNAASVMSKTAGLDLREDVIRNTNGRYAIEPYRFGALRVNRYRLNAAGVSKVIAEDMEALKAFGIDSFIFNVDRPASSFNKTSLWREDAAAEIAASLAKARAQAAYIAFEGNSVLPQYLPCIEAVTGFSAEASLFPYVTDTVPFASIVLRGPVDLFAFNLNDASSTEEYLLRVIEWGLYPSCLLTWEYPRELLYSDTFSIISSKYDVWKEDLLRVYNAANEALSAVKGSSIENHKVLETGVMKTTYDNGVEVYVNYNRRPWIGEGVTLPARGSFTRRPEK
ncbi:MAG: DUF5696 domain-containing protein [Treponema sp.]|nr:DUF5696 domain-containing protein [Treponema sp.]